ncbi:MAG: lipopolysaccharide kinase InaA family protein [Methylotenera sp.]
MKVKQPSMLTEQVIRDGLGYIFRGGLRIKNGHFPSAGHTIPKIFIGVGVATNANPETDDYVIEQVRTLGIHRVRLDFTYGDFANHNARFLNRLIAENFEITLHIVQPFDAAKNMQSSAEQDIWRHFLQDILTTFGSQITQIEIGNTINRKRWAGYTFDGFLYAWNIAYALFKGEFSNAKITLIGPNIQDFEPLYNISLLKLFQQKNQLPDIHSNNLFVERVSEPERFDHRVFKYRWATIFKYNLIKKARTLQKIGQDFGVNNTISSAAFWAIYRIERLLVHGAQKQADYLTRYFTLLATSNALQQANWGALICHREGLIDDGLSDAEYPALERICHYQNVDGDLENYKLQPSFFAMQTMVKWICGAQYLGAIANAKGLEIHAFLNHGKRIHVAWTVNGKVAFLNNIYTKDALEASWILGCRGDVLNGLDIISESPIYLQWDEDTEIITEIEPTLQKNLAIHAHVEGLQYFRLNDGDWQGLVLAKDANDAKLIMQNLHPDKLHAPTKDAALRHARNAIWNVVDPRDVAKQITIKQPVNMYPHKAFLDKFKPSKAKRSWNGAMELMRRGVATAQPIAYFEKTGDSTLKQNFFLCDYVQADCNIGQIFSAFSGGETTFLDLKPEDVLTQLAQYCHLMHSRGIHFRDLSGGNILVNILPNNKLEFSLIDTARLHSFNHPTALKLRVADLTRACHKLNWEHRERFMNIYLGLTGRKFRWQDKLQFQLYDFKVTTKRTIGRKGIKRLIKRIKGAE